MREKWTDEMPGKGFKTTALEVDVLNDLRKLAYELSIQEDDRVTLSATVRLLLQTYYTYNPRTNGNTGLCK